ncbi:hypothetical protein E2C01_102037 [Portunus trituberculatus]|uniref:Uncharacterized protein n=1 Tax=Portunus trituberculatus TaxID=210409 RepID=A0A5B7KHH8_PORTR|nr:hypothetical protein [Portunus trituberculatus]
MEGDETKTQTKTISRQTDGEAHNGKINARRSSRRVTIPEEWRRDGIIR